MAVGRCPVDSARLGVDVTPLEAAAKTLRRNVDEGRMPGFLSYALKDGHIVHQAAYGFADKEAKSKMSLDTVFRLYSQTKPVTVVGFMRLYEQGLVQLDDPVHKFIPQFKNTPVEVGIRKKRLEPMKRPIEVRDLLAHTSGIGFGPGFGYLASCDYEQVYVGLATTMDAFGVPSLKSWCEQLAKIPLRFHPGSDWGYGYSSDVLGRVIEVVSGRSLAEYLKTEILDPLDMRDTTFAMDPAKRNTQRLAALHRLEPSDGSGPDPQILTVDPGASAAPGSVTRKVLPPSGADSEPVAWPEVPQTSVFVAPGANPVTQGGGCVCSVAGGLVSTLRDYARFGQMLLDGGALGSVRILKESTVDLLQRCWINDFVSRKRRKPLFVWGIPGAGFSPLGQVGVAHPEATGPRRPGAKLRTVQWGGAGGSGYSIDWPNRMLVLTYSGVIYDTDTQRAMWNAAAAALYRGKTARRARTRTGPVRTSADKRRARVLQRSALRTVRRMGSATKRSLPRQEASVIAKRLRTAL